MPVRAAPAAAPRARRPRSRPRAAGRPRRGAAAPSGSRCSGRSRPPSSRPARGVIRSSASASCISAIGRSNARGARAWSTHGIGAISARDIPLQSRGASTPARPGEVEGRLDPERPVEVQVELGLGHRLGQASEGGRHPSMLRFRAHVHHPGHGRGRLRRQLDHPGPAPRRPSRRGDGPHARRRRRRPRPPAARLARPRRAADRRRHAARVAAGPGRGRRRDPAPRGHPARPQRRRGAVPGQHRRDAQRRRRGHRRRGPPLHPHGRAGRGRRPGAALRELEGEGGGARPRVRARLDDPQAVAPVRRGRRLLQHHRRPRPDVTRDRAGAGRRAQPVPADPRRRRRPDRRPLPRGPRDGRRDVRPGRAALLDLSRDHRARSPGRSGSGGGSSRCRCR